MSSCSSRCRRVGAAIAVVLLVTGLPVWTVLTGAPASAATVTYPMRSGTNWVVDPKGQRLESRDQDMQILRKGHDLFLSSQFWWSNGVGAYMGLQTPELRNPARDQYIWSVWGAIDSRIPPGVLIGENKPCEVHPRSATGEGESTSCIVAATIDETHVYRLHVEVLRDAAGNQRRGKNSGVDPAGGPEGTWWHGEIRDVTAGTAVDMGDVLVEDTPVKDGSGAVVGWTPADSLGNDVWNWVEYMSWGYLADTCRDQTSPFVVDVKAPQSNVSTDVKVVPDEATTPSDACWSVERSYDTDTRVMRMQRRDVGWTATGTWTLPAPAGGITSVDTDITATTLTPGAAARTEATLTGGSVVHVGVETAYAPYGGTVTDEAVVSVPGGTSGFGSCRSTAHSGAGVTCRVPFPLTAGHTYRLRLQLDTAAKLVGAFILDLATPSASPTAIGIIAVPSLPPVSALRSVANIFGARENCDTPEVLDTTFAPPGVNATGSMGTPTYAGRGTTPTLTRTDCTGGDTVVSGGSVRARIGGPRAQANQSWVGTQPDGTNVNVQQDVTIGSGVDGVNTSLNWTWAGVTHPGTGLPFGGGIGIRNDTVRFDGTRGDVAYVAYDEYQIDPWAASTLVGDDGHAARCTIWGTDLRVGYQHVCEVPMTVQAGRTYRFRVTRQGIDTHDPTKPDDDTQKWNAVVIDTATSAVLLNAVFHTPTNVRLLGALRNNAVYSGHVPSCASVPRETVTFTRPGFNWNGFTFGRTTTAGSSSVRSTAGCTAPTVTNLGGSPVKVRMVTAG